MLFVQLRVDGERQDFAAGGLRLGKLARAVSKITECRLKVQGTGIVDFGRNAPGAQKFSQTVPLGASHRELVIDVKAARRRCGRLYVRNQPDLVEKRAVTFCFLPPPASPVRQVP